MSHYFAIALVPQGTEDIKEAVGKLLEPYSEHLEDEQPHFWNWWRIGGRWDGALLADRKTWQEAGCPICDGNGPDSISHHYSDAHEQVGNNVVEVGRLPEDCHAYRLILPDGNTLSQRQSEDCDICYGYFNADDISYEAWKAHCAEHGHGFDKPDEVWLPEFRSALVGYHNYLAVGLDYHS